MTVTRNLVGYRYSVRPHTDLLDVISFFGAARKWNLDFACKVFGVESPKEHGMDGFSVGPYYRSGRLREIALYCRRDVEATARQVAAAKATVASMIDAKTLVVANVGQEPNAAELATLVQRVKAAGVTAVFSMP